MPSPTKLALVSGLVMTAGIFLGGAWIASAMPGDKAAALSAGAHTARSMPQPSPGGSREEARRPTLGTASPLHLSIHGVRGPEGKVLVLVFDTPSAFDALDYTQAVGYAELPATTASLTHVFDSLIAGPYAIALFHDENGNQDFDMVDGYPAEGYGTSNASGPYDMPTFQRASVRAGHVVVDIHYPD